MGHGGVGVVSLERARECIGRPIKHVSSGVEGTVAAVSKHGVFVDVGGEIVPCKPENLEWDNPVFVPVIAALRTGTDYEGAQAFVEHDKDLNEYIFIGSSAPANDDELDHMLYVGFPMMRRFHPVRPTADPWAAYFFEEVCGWASP